MLTTLCDALSSPDVDECETPNFCIDEAECMNIHGSAICHCPTGYEGDGKVNGTGCTGIVKYCFQSCNCMLYYLIKLISAQESLPKKLLSVV